MEQKINLQNFEGNLERTINESKDRENFGFIGLFGSMKVENDIDMVITPNPNVSKGKFLKSLCNFLYELRANTEKQGSRLIAFTHSYNQEEVAFLSDRNPERDYLVHIISFPDLLSDNKSLINTITEANKIFYGDKDNLSKIPATSMEFFYNYLLFSNCLLAHYPNELETRKIQKKTKYVAKHAHITLDAENKSNRDLYDECCDIIDKEIERREN